MSSPSVSRYWFIIPAAGIGTRMNADKPKQYLSLHNKTILEHTLERLLQLPNLAGIVVAISPEDSYWKNISLSQHPMVHSVPGGKERADSVRHGLLYLEHLAAADDWILVHDAARPCVTLNSMLHLIETLADTPVGGILAVPVSDTLKRVEQQHIQETLDRRPLWQAQTPQMFRYQLLSECLAQALAANALITDESSAVEWCGYQPLIVEGRTDNIKITRPDDLGLAAFILAQQLKQE